MWFHPPSLKKAKRVPTDDPGEKDDSLLDVTKRKEAHKQRMQLLKRSPPGGLPALIPARTTLVSPTLSTYVPLQASAHINSRRSRMRRGSGGGMFRAFGAAKI